MCATKIRNGVRYCWKCQGDQAQVGPPGWSVDTDGNARGTSRKISQQFGRPLKAMTFDEFHKSKTSHRNLTPSHERKKMRNIDEDVTISIGRKHFIDGKLKNVWGKRLPIKIQKSATCSDILEKALSKWKAFDRNFDDKIEYLLVYDDGGSAQFMPGSFKDFFKLSTYREELGKDYKRITLFLCPLMDHLACEGVLDGIFVDSDENAQESLGDFSLPPLDTDVGELIPDVGEVEDLSKVAESVVVDEENGSVISEANDPVGPVVNDVSDVYCKLREKVDEEKHFFLITHRSAPLQRVLRPWQRQKHAAPVTNTLRVKFNGEDGIDQGAISKEFLHDTISEIGTEMFTNGTPIESTYHVQNGNLRTCGKIAAVSIAQVGPPPCFLEPCAFRCIFEDVDMVDIRDDNLTVYEMTLIEELKKNCKAHEDFIIENGYTGPIDDAHIHEIIRSLKVSFVSHRMLYMKEFAKGLESYGLQGIVTTNPSACEDLFVKDKGQRLKPDANYLFSLIVPDYSPAGTSRRMVEEEMMDHFQDLLNRIEDINISSYDTAIAVREFADGGCLESANEESANQQFEAPEVSIEGVMGWLTGQQHKPVGNVEAPVVQCYFDHDCLVRNPAHRVCYPIVSACAKEITFPVAHMQTRQSFHDIFIMAFCKGHAFCRH